jgi:MerR family copper efflux transcriptional regulator
MKQIAVLLALWQDRDRSSSEVKRLVKERIAELDLRIRELAEIKGTLEYLAMHCKGNSRPECPILDVLVNVKD